MNMFHKTLLAFALSSTSAMAFSVDVAFPNLTWPAEPAAPVTQDCTKPAGLGPDACKTTE